MTIFTLIWSECYGDSVFLGVFENKAEVEEAINNNLLFRNLEEKEEIIEEEYLVIKSTLNKRKEEKI